MKLPCSSVRSGWLLVVSAVLSLVLGLLAGSARPAASAASSRTTADCTPGIAGHVGSCVDPIGDVQGAAGPDIVRVTQYEWGVILFRVTFAQAPPLSHSTAYRDDVSVALTAVGTTTKRYLLTVSATDLKHQVLQRLPNGKRMILPGTGPARSGKTVTLSVDLRPFVGPPSVVRYRVKATRVMLDGTVASSDYVPNHGTMVWRPVGQ